jgi:hypothetical protein
MLGPFCTCIATAKVLQQHPLQCSYSCTAAEPHAAAGCRVRWFKALADYRAASGHCNPWALAQVHRAASAGLPHPTRLKGRGGGLPAFDLPPRTLTTGGRFPCILPLFAVLYSILYSIL